MRKPYRVIIWGPGSIGRACLRELSRRKEFEIAGVLAFSPHKAGMDAGELINRQPMGIRITMDKEAIFAMEADCVLWTGTFPSTEVLAREMEEDILRLLRSGKNVVTPAAMHYLHSQGPEQVKKFEDACREGNTCFHGTGENPGFWLERVALTLTGVCNDVDSISLDEYADCALGGMSTEILNAIGFGMPMNTAAEIAKALGVTWNRHHFIESINFASKSLYGKHLDRFEFTPKFYLAEEEVILDREKGDGITMVIPAGCVKAMTHRFQGFVDDRTLSITVNWFLMPRTSPFGDKKDSTWDIEIEGRPTSLKCSISAMASFKNHLERYPCDPTSPTWYATITPVIQAIPIVCSREPGIVYASAFAASAPDLRLLETRKSLVD